MKIRLLPIEEHDFKVWDKLNISTSSKKMQMLGNIYDNAHFTRKTNKVVCISKYKFPTKFVEILEADPPTKDNSVDFVDEASLRITKALEKIVKSLDERITTLEEIITGSEIEIPINPGKASDE